MGAAAILIVPAYIWMLGLEAFGIVSLYLVLNTWMGLLNFGLSSTLSRAASRFRAEAIDGAQLRGLLGSVERITLLVAIASAVAVAAIAPWLVSYWLKLDRLEPSDAVIALRLTGLVIAVRFLGSPYRSILAGLEDLRWLGGFNILITTLRTLVVIPVMALAGAKLPVFFIWVLAVGIGETFYLAWRARLRSPRGGAGRGFAELKGHWRYSIALGLSAALWVIATTADKAIISGAVTLSSYAVFSVAIMAATAVEMVAQPVVLAFGPRLTFLHGAERTAEFNQIYDSMTQLTAILACSSAAFLCALASHVLFAWADNPAVTVFAAPVLAGYAAGNALLAIGASPLQLQSATGRVGLHLAATILFTFAVIAGLSLLVPTFGIRGAAWTWLAVNAAMFVFYVPIAHHRFYHGSHWSWLIRNVLPIALAATVSGALARMFFPVGLGRVETVAALAVAGVAIFGVTALSSSVARSQLRAVRERIAGKSRTT